MERRGDRSNMKNEPLFDKKFTLFLIGLAVIAICSPFVLSSGYMLRLMVTICSNIIAAICLNVVLGYMGYPSLSQSVFFGVGAYTMALCTVKLGWSPWLALVLSPITSFVVGYLVAVPFLKLRSMFFAIGTLAFMGVFNAILVNSHKITGAESGLRGIPRLFHSDTIFFFFEVILIFALVIGTKVMTRSYWGKILIAIREDEDLAPHFGIDIQKYKVMTFAVTSAITGLAGAMFISYQTFISSNYFTIASSFTILASSVIGGAGSIFGPIYGALVVIGAPEVLRGMALWRPSFVGAVLVIVILLSPDGINGVIGKISMLLKGIGKNK